jgi:hypothetical protein
MRKRAELFAHIQNTRSQYNLPDPLGCIAKPQNRQGIVDRFNDPSVQKSMAVDSAFKVYSLPRCEPQNEFSCL